MNSNIENLKKSKMKNGNTVEDNLVALIAKLVKKLLLVKQKQFQILHQKLSIFTHSC